MEKKVSVITGASGHIGYALLLNLLDKGEDVRILIRKNLPKFDGLKCEKVFGDVTKPETLDKAFKNAEIVYHLAGVIDINNTDDTLIRNVNIEGTENVAEACERAGVKRLVYASSVDAYPPLKDNEVMHEIDSFNPDILDGTYAKTKAIATQFIIDKCKNDNLNAVIVYPGACIGPYDFKVSNAGEMVRMYMKGSFPSSLSFGAYNFVDVRDIAEGMYSAAQNGRKGEGYILCGEEVTTDDFIKIVAKACGKKPPKVKMPYGIVKRAAPLMETYYRVSKKTPLFTRYTIRKLTSNCNFSIEKAENELDYHPMSVEKSVTDMVEWIRENESK